MSTGLPMTMGCDRASCISLAASATLPRSELSTTNTTPCTSEKYSGHTPRMRLPPPRS